MSKDYYAALGVEKNATQDEIKKAFRKKAHKYHPDKATGDEAKFKEVNEAYQVLGDEGKRQQYDQFGSNFDQQGGFGGGAGWEDFMNAARGGGGFGNGGVQFDFGGIDLGDLFGFGGGRSRSRGKARGRDVQMDIEITFEEAVFGVEKELKVQKNNACDVCDGKGAEPGSTTKTCDECKGQGQVTRVQQTMFGPMQSAHTCNICHGTGSVPEKTCKHCGGDGTVRSESKFTVKIPAGIDNGQSIRLSGKGEFPGTGGVAGDMYVVVHVKESKQFERKGSDIYLDLEVSYPQAVLGDTIEIDTLEGKKKFVVPSGTKSHQEFRLRGLGIERLQRSGKGDMFVTVIVYIPKKVSKKAKKLIEELQSELEK
ncbi:molecular chaperone DnaJ [Patescibacteria group bacterium]|nr:molecular chaperone DnaJ [Patescibacteria group bacterium]MBU1721471.1 molecular chaperone DnaJ [Patescibacteria group bacterium]MBU1900772.1 molecular chaperone DnaJ [Patescibacteria group bacterium]